MPNLIDTIIKTREIGADIFVKSLTNLEGLSEAAIKEKLVSEIKNHSEIFPEGWYNPPPSGIVVLLAPKPFTRLLYKTNRDSDYWPQETFTLNAETVGNIYISPVNRWTNMFGDIGFTFYRGTDKKIKEHLKHCYFAILEIAKYTQVGMKFSEICDFALNIYKNKLRPTQWLTVNSDPNHILNLGHTVPGSFEKDFIFGNNFEAIKETIKTKRIYINDNEDFAIPETCAFTLESRLEDYDDPGLPSVFFHFIVCFNRGGKTILNNFDEIFKTVGMDYISLK
jgi:hypothetical protein